MYLLSIASIGTILLVYFFYIIENVWTLSVKRDKFTLDRNSIMSSIITVILILLIVVMDWVIKFADKCNF